MTVWGMAGESDGKGLLGKSGGAIGILRLREIHPAKRGESHFAQDDSVG